MNLFYQPLIQDGVLCLTAEESKHCVKVLRKQKGDTISVTDGKGFFYTAIIEKPDLQQCTFSVAETIPEVKKDFFIHIAISPTKNTDRIEWFVEKSTELGIDKITLLECKNTERAFLKTDRLEKIAISAMKQSLKASIPTIEGLSTFANIVQKKDEDQRFIAYVDYTNTQYLKDLVIAKSRYLVLIGPEGDFTKEELNRALEYEFKKVSLGTSRLRTETAGIAACHVLNLSNY